MLPTAIIDCDHYLIKEKAQDLTEGQAEVTEKARIFFYFVRDEVRYNPYLFTLLPEHLRASATLEKREGFCVQKAVLLAALARAVGIPARLRFGDLRNHLVPRKLLEKLLETIHTDVFLWHGYNELYIHGKWLKVTSAFDIEMCKENRIIPVEFDGKKDAVFHSHTLDGRLHIEYVKDHGHYEDVPLDKIVEAYNRLKG